MSLPVPPCQFEIRQLRAHLAQQDLDLVAEREAAMQIHHVWGKQSSSFQEVDGLGPAASDTESRVKRREPGALTGNNPRVPFVPNHTLCCRLGSCVMVHFRHMIEKRSGPNRN